MTSYINDPKFVQKWLRIRRHLTTTAYVYETYSQLAIKTQSVTLYLSKNSDKMRLYSHLDWVHYTAQHLAKAIDLDQVTAYYEIQMQNPLSDPNVWSNQDFEQMLKSYYAARAGRASLI